MKTEKDFKALEKSNFFWIVAFYRESCGFCALLRPVPPPWRSPAAPGRDPGTAP